MSTAEVQLNLSTGAYDPVEPVKPIGWQCPSCNRCFAPSVSKCDSCGPPTYTSNGTSGPMYLWRCHEHGWLSSPNASCPVCAGEITG